MKTRSKAALLKEIKRLKWERDEALKVRDSYVRHNSDLLTQLSRIWDLQAKADVAFQSRLAAHIDSQLKAAVETLPDGRVVRILSIPKDYREPNNDD